MCDLYGGSRESGEFSVFDTGGAFAVYTQLSEEDKAELSKLVVLFGGDDRACLACTFEAGLRENLKQLQ